MKFNGAFIWVVGYTWAGGRLVGVVDRQVKKFIAVVSDLVAWCYLCVFLLLNLVSVAPVA